MYILPVDECYMREFHHLPSLEQDLHLHTVGHCTCQPLSPFLRSESQMNESAAEIVAYIPVSPPLQAALLAALPHTTAFSLLLLHITQFEHIPMPPSAAIVHKRVGHHAPASLLAQILHNIRRTLRVSDQILTDEQGTGAAIFFPLVDQEGIVRIAERISRNIHLLQAETVIPPLQHETEIVLGFGSCPSPARSLEEALYRADLLQEKITFRPAVISQPMHLLAPVTNPRPAEKTIRTREAHQHTPRANCIPFMQLPTRLPTRLKQFIPHTLALELRCAPVGRDHNRLTVAMDNPTDSRALFRLRETTGMVIFPVACESSALETLLASNW